MTSMENMFDKEGRKSVGPTVGSQTSSEAPDYKVPAASIVQD